LYKNVLLAKCEGSSYGLQTDTSPRTSWGPSWQRDGDCIRRGLSGHSFLRAQNPEFSGERVADYQNIRQRVFFFAIV
jgi:hypothetical protein